MTRIPIVQGFTKQYLNSYYHKNTVYNGGYRYYCNVNKDLFYRLFCGDDMAFALYCTTGNKVRTTLMALEYFGIGWEEE